MNYVWVGILLLGMGCNSLPTSTEYVARGDGYLKDGKTKEAICAYNKAIALNAKNQAAYESRATAYFYSGQYGAAARDFEHVLREDPYRFPVYTAYASTLAAQGEFPQALELLNQAVALRPQSAETYFARAGVLVMLGKYDLAVADYTRTLQLRPSADVFRARGVAYQQWGKPEQARQDFEQAQNPNLPQHLNDYTRMN